MEWEIIKIALDNISEPEMHQYLKEAGFDESREEEVAEALNDIQQKWADT